MRILFTICARAGSKGLKDKNLKEMRGAPLVYYTLAVIKGYIDKHPKDYVNTVLNTDSKPLVSLVQKQNAVNISYVKRKQEFAGDIVPKVDVIKDTYMETLDFNADVIIDLDITSPMRKVADIERVVEEYNKGRYDLVFSVVKARRSPYFNMVEKNPDGCYRKICQSDFTARQQAPKSYEMNASIYAYSPSFLKKTIDKTILDYNCGISVMPDYLVLDIDSEEDFVMMQYLHEFYCLHDEGLSLVYEQAKEL